MTTDDDRRDEIRCPESVTTAAQYQMTRQSSDVKDDGGSPRITNIIHHYSTDITETSKPKDKQLPNVLPSAEFITIDSPTNNSKSALMNGGLNIRSPVSSNTEPEQVKYFCPDSTHQLDDNISNQMRVEAQDIPDVCPKNSGSSHSFIRQQSQEGPCQEDDRVSLTSHQSNTSYVNLPDQVHGIARHTSVNLRRQDSTSPTPVGLRGQDNMSPIPVGLHHQDSINLPPKGLHHKDRMSPTLKSFQRQDSLSPTPSLPHILPASNKPHVPSPSTFCPNKTPQYGMHQRQPHTKQHQHPGPQGCLHHHGHRNGFEKQQQDRNHQTHLEYRQRLPVQETERGITQYCNTDSTELHQAGPYCHQPSHPRQHSEPQGHLGHQQTPSNQMHHRGYQGRAYPQQNLHSVPHQNPPYRYPSPEYNLPDQHSSPHYHHSRDYQYTIPFQEEGWRGGHSQLPAAEQHQLQCIREEPSSDPLGGADPKSCIAETNCDDEGERAHDESSHGKSASEILNNKEHKWERTW
ncbi:uncharacterized protein LOC135214217 [Macrobrachium nipponense]|uniref:uncharacterized protein LOC135214217 n=1 Tax=Macrobrachium nipponense TaxID=159736 RepID=UPI0030C7C826